MRQDRVVSEVLGHETVLTPSDLYHKQFRHSVVGGYRPSEVDAYLQRVADVLESLIRQVRELKAAIEDHKEQLEGYHDIEETLRNALAASQKFSESYVEAARRESENMIAAAQIEKDRVMAEAATLPAALAREIGSLRDQRDRLRADMMSILAAHRTMLESQIPAHTGADGGSRPAPPDETEMQA